MTRYPSVDQKKRKKKKIKERELKVGGEISFNLNSSLEIATDKNNLNTWHEQQFFHFRLTISNLFEQHWQDYLLEG